jgi:hypothetical protein
MIKVLVDDSPSTLADIAISHLVLSVRLAVMLLEEGQSTHKALRVLRQALACFGGDDDGTEILRG